METVPHSSLNNLKKLQTLVARKDALLEQKNSEIKTLQEKYQYLLELFRLAQHKQFGKSAEAHPGQGELFNEAEQVIHYERNKPKRKPLPKDLPREVRVVDIPDEDKICNCCGDDLHCMGEKTSEQLEFIPAQIKVIETVRPQYGCRRCENTATQVQIKIAPVPLSPIPKSIATASLLAQTITSKYQYSLPLYRQEAMFKQYGIVLNRKTMSEWMIKSSRLFKRLIDDLHQVLLKQPVIQADGHKGYDKLDSPLIGCMAHARRKFIEAKTAQPKSKTGRANVALNHIKKLYRIEKEIKDLPAEKKLKVSCLGMFS